MTTLTIEAVLGRKENLMGRTFGRLTVVGFYHRTKLWSCQCSCGNPKLVAVSTASLKNGSTQSCKCIRKEQLRKRAQLPRTPAQTEHSREIGLASRKHGQSKTPLYRVWSSQKQRCLNPNRKDFPRYGGRGILFFEPWADDFQAYYDYIMRVLGPKPAAGMSIDRIDNNGNYEPGNLKWSTALEQVHNRRTRRTKTTPQNIAVIESAIQLREAA